MVLHLKSVACAEYRRSIVKLVIARRPYDVLIWEKGVISTGFQRFGETVPNIPVQ